MIFIIHGRESFLARKQLEETKNRFLEKNSDGYNLSIFELGGSLDLEGIKSSFKSFSLFSSKMKLVVFKDFSLSREEAKKDKLIKIIEEGCFTSSKIIHIIFFESHDISKDPFYGRIKNIAGESLFKEMPPFQIEKWVSEKFKKAGIRALPALIKKIAADSEKDLWRINNEAEKLISYAVFSGSAELDEEAASLIVSENFEKNIFKTVDSISRKNFKGAIRMICGHMENSESELYLLSMIAYQFRNLIKIKSAAGGSNPINLLSKSLKMHPFVLKKSLEQAKKFSLEELKSIFLKISKTEMEIKKGRNGKEALIGLVMELCL